MSPFREIAVLPPRSQNRHNPQISRGSSTDWLQTDARPSRDGSERSSGPARKHAISVYGFY